MENEALEERKKYGVPFAEYERINNLYLQALKSKMDHVLRPKISDQFRAISELVESGALSDEEAVNAVMRILKQYRAAKDSDNGV